MRSIFNSTLLLWMLVLGLSTGLRGQNQSASATASADATISISNRDGATTTSREVTISVGRNNQPVVNVKVDRPMRKHKIGASGNNLVGVGNNVFLPLNEKTDDVVVVRGDAVLNGEVMGDVVAVMSTVKINGHVHGEVVSVLSTVEPGPSAVIDGKSVGVLGGAPTGNRGNILMGNLVPWLAHLSFLGLKLTSWAWMVFLGGLVFYIFLALLFRHPMQTCIAVLEDYPGRSFLSGVVVALAFFPLLVFSFFTIIGPVVLSLAVLMMMLFGRASVLAFIGGGMTGLVRADGSHLHPALALLVGALIAGLFYLVPLFGLLLWGLIGLLGTGSVTYALIRASQRKPSAPVVAGLDVSPPIPVVEGTPLVVPVVSPLSAPRAGFGLRLLASWLDLILVGFICALLHVPDPLFILVFTLYHIALWSLRGATVGGIICRLKLVRLDDSPLTPTVAVVRALAAFLSLLALGLGFIWVAFDPEIQSWHDRVAGTVIVKMPKGQSLV